VRGGGWGARAEGHERATSERAVKAHVTALFDLFKADSRTELAVIACHAGLRSPSGHNPFVT